MLKSEFRTGVKPNRGLHFAFCILPSALLSVCLPSAGCSASEAPRHPDVITIAVRSGPNTLDPRLSNDEGTQRLSQLVYSPLLQHGNDLRIGPALAQRLDNPDPLTYIVHLRRGVRFHDGHELTSRDVVYTFKSIFDPATVSPFRGSFRALKDVAALDDYTVVFTLSEPFAAFPIQLTGVPPVVPADAGDSLRTFPIGTGPYRFVRYDSDDTLVLSAFEGYWDGLPNNAGIVMKVVPDDTMRGLELRKGSTDLVVNDLPPDIVHQLEKSDQFSIERSPGLDFFYLGFNLRDPVLADVRVRHAIGYATNRDAIISYLRRGLGRPAVGLIPDLAWAFEPDVFRFAYDPDRAGRLLDEAGFPDPDGGGPAPRLRLSLRISTNEETRLQATAIQHDLKMVGIALDVRSYEFATFYSDVVKGNFQLFALQWVGGAMIDPDMLRRVFHSREVPPEGFNRGYYRNPHVDQMLDLATTALDEGTRKRYYSAAQKLIAADAPYIPIWSKTNVIVAQKGLEGLHLSPAGDFTALRDVRRVPMPPSAARSEARD
jgi:peptide/nickel transport system substrate-binding protein